MTDHHIDKRSRADRIKELESVGYEKIHNACPICGDNLWENGTNVTIDGDEFHEVQRECPSCGYYTVEYDD